MKRWNRIPLKTDRNKRKSDFSVFQKEMYLENYILKYKTSNQISKKQTQTIETLNDCDATQSEADRDCEGDKLECPAQSTKKGQAKKSAGWDALALRAEERRDKLRKAAGRSKYPMIRGCLNGETWQRKPLSLYTEFIGIQREPGN